MQAYWLKFLARPGAAVWAIFLLALAVRGITAIPGFLHMELDGTYTDDSPRYERLALTLLKEGVYEAHPYSHYKGLDRPLYSGPEYFRVPGYPLFLAAIYAVTGYSTQAALAVQVLLSALICVLVYQVGRSLWSHRIGFIAALLMIANLKGGIHAGQITSEVLFTFLTVLSLWAALRFWRHPDWKSALLLTGPLVALAMTRPIGWHMTILLAAGTWLFFRSRRVAILLLIPVMLVTATVQAWSYRTYLLSGVWTVTSNDSTTLGLWYPATIWAYAHKKTYREGEIEVLRRHVETHPQYEPLYRGALADPLQGHVWRSGGVHDIKLMESLRPLGMRMLVEEWPTTLKTMVTGSVWSLFSGMGEWRNWILSREMYDRIGSDVAAAKSKLASFELNGAMTAISDLLQRAPPGALLVFVFLAGLHIVLVAGALLGLRRLLTGSAYGWLFLLWGLYFLATAAPSGNARYLAPFLPLLALAAPHGFPARWRDGASDDIRQRVAAAEQ